MFDKKEFENAADVETVVGATVKLKGNLKSEGNIIVNGSVSGDIRTKGAVSIGAGAEVRANIKAKNAIVSGIVQGNIVASEQLSITETGKVYGDIQANILSIAPGALFSGKCMMAEEEKITVIEPVAELEEGIAILEEETLI